MRIPDRFPGGWRRAADAFLAQADATLTRRWAGHAVLLAALLAAGAFSVALGADANWDLRNYHLYNPYAFLEGRYLRDIAPAGMQTYFHPLFDVPFYLLVTRLPEWPRLTAFLMGLPHGLNAALLFLIARRLFPAPLPGRAIAVAAAMLLGLTGAAILPTVGGTMNDYAVAPFALAGLYAALRAWAPLAGETPRPGVWMAVAGLALGLGTGLKLTLAPFGAALAIALLFAGQPWRETARGVALYLGAAALIFATVAGPWMLFLYESFGNPLFPNFNNFFRSPLAPIDQFRDTRWFPRSAWDYAAFPFLWAFEITDRISEWRMRDPRLAAALTAGALAAGLWLFGARRKGQADAAASTVTAWRLVAIFGVAGYAAWVLLFAYLRYAAPIELLAGLPVAGLAFLLLRGSAAILATLAAAAAIMAATYYPAWERVPFNQRYIEIAAPALPPNSVVVLAGKPMAHVIPFMARDARFVAIANEMNYPAHTHGFIRAARALIEGHGGPLLVIEFAHQAARADETLAAYGLARADEPCRPIVAKIDEHPLRLCVLRRR